MQSERNQPFSATELLDALPFFVMILDSNHHVIDANTFFCRNVGYDAEICPVECHAAVHHTGSPHPDCPLLESIKTGLPATRLLADELHSALRVTTYPLGNRPPFGPLYLHFAQPV